LQNIVLKMQKKSIIIDIPSLLNLLCFKTSKLRHKKFVKKAMYHYSTLPILSVLYPYFTERINGTVYMR